MSVEPYSIATCPNMGTIWLSVSEFWWNW